MYEFKLKGSYYDIGIQQGEILKNSGITHFEASEKRRIYAEKCEVLVKKYMPEIIEELKGIADGWGQSYDDVKISPIALYVDLIIPSCGIVAISGEHTKSGKPMFIRNYDFYNSCIEEFTAFSVELSGGYSHLGFCDFYGSRYGGVNEKGLAVAISNSAYYKYKPKPGITMNLAAKYALEQCQNTEEAITLLEKLPHFHNFNFILCDKESNIARVETCPDKVRTLRYKEGIGISTNHYQKEEMKEYEDTIPHNDSTYERFKAAKIWFDKHKGIISIENAKSLASSHKPGLCDHFDDGGTIWSWIYNIGDSKMLIAQGSPCKNEYKLYKMSFKP